MDDPTTPPSDQPPPGSAGILPVPSLVPDATAPVSDAPSPDPKPPPARLVYFTEGDDGD